MAKKLQSLESKLGSWTDQADLTRSQSGDPTRADDSASTRPERATYSVNRSLMDRVADLAQTHAMSESQVIGSLLTWALDQVNSGAHEFNPRP